MNNNPVNKIERKILLVLAIVVVIGALFLSLVNFIANFLWFKEMGYLDVFFKQLVTQLTVGIPTFVVVTALVILYLNHLRKGYFKQIASGEETDMKALKKATIVLALLFGAGATFFAVTQLWFEILKFANSTGFDIQDPLFHLDIGFYLFKLDFLTQLNELLIGVIIGFVALTVIYYILLLTVRTPDMFEDNPQQGQTQEQEQYDDGRYSGASNPFENAAKGAEDIFSKFGFKIKRKAPQPRKQFDDDNFKRLMKIASGKIAGLGCIFFLMLAIDFFLKQFDLLHAHTGAVYGAGFTDVNITLWMYRILCGLAVISAILFVVYMAKKQYKKILTVPVVMIGSEPARRCLSRTSSYLRMNCRRKRLICSTTLNIRSMHMDLKT